MKNNNNLPRYVRVNAGVKAYSSAMHGELHQQLYNLIAAQDKQKLHLTDEQLKVWNDLIMQEVELNNAQQDTELTAKMQQLDDDRDALLSQLFSTVRNNRRSPVKALCEPAERLVKLVDSYKGIQREVLQAESLHVNGLLMDLAKQSADTAALGLTAVIAMLKTTNEEFEELELKRIDGTDKSGSTSTKAVRPLTDEKFYEVRGNVEAAFYYATTATDKQMIATLVDNLNAMLTRYATSRKSSEAQKAIARSATVKPKGGNHGSDGKKPSDDGKQPGGGAGSKQPSGDGSNPSGNGGGAGDGKNGGSGNPDGNKPGGSGQGDATITPKK